MDSTATKIPAAPTPAKARPKMRTLTEGAAAQMTDPTSKTVIAKRKVPGRRKRISSVQRASYIPKLTLAVKDSERLTIEKQESGLSEEVGPAEALRGQRRILEFGLQGVQMAKAMSS